MAEAAAEAVAEEGGGGDVEAKETAERGAMMMKSRKEKRKAMKKMKRKQTRKEMALKEREEAGDDPEELIRIRTMEEEEAARSERERKLFEERELAWIQAMEIKKHQQRLLLEEEEQGRIELGLQLPEVENANESNDDWEYVEEGPAEIIWQGNEITVKKKRVKVPKRNKDPDRPTSNPLPPQSEAFSDYKNSSLSAQQLMENVAQQVPNFGTEQDKAHCPFHLKTGACRFGHHCSRVHFYPNKSCTLLIKNMYNGPGLAWEQDEVLEYNDEEIERCFEEFYEDVHTEFLKYGEIINFKVCRNGAFHLRGNVYIHFKSIDSAVLAHESLNARYFAGKQISCEFINVTKWKVALCGEYMKSRYKTCSRGTACNFIHSFRNPGGDYEWADSDRPPPRYWVEKMVALFGYSEAYEKKVLEKEVSEKDFGQLRNSSKMTISESKRYKLRRSRSGERDYSSFSHLDRKYDTESYSGGDPGRQRCTGDDKHPNKTHEEDLCEEERVKDYYYRKRRKCDIESGVQFSDKGTDRHHVHTKKSSKRQYENHKNKDYRTESDGNLSDKERNRVAQHGCTRSSSQHQKVELLDDHGDYETKNHEVDGDWSERDNNREEYHDSRRSSRQKRKVRYPDNRKDSKNRSHDTDEEWSDSNRKVYEDHNRKKSVRAISTKVSNHGDRTTRVCRSQHSDDMLDSNAERYPSHARKRSKHFAEVSDTADNQVPKEQLKYRCDRLSTERRKGDSLVKSVTSDENHEGLCQDNEKYRSRHLDMRHMSDARMHQEDRWEPEHGSVEIFHRSERKAESSDDNKSGRPGPCNGTDESSDSEVYSKEKVSREHQYESGQATPSKHRDSRRKSTGNHHKLDSKNRSRGSSQSKP